LVTWKLFLTFINLGIRKIFHLLANLFSGDKVVIQFQSTVIKPTTSTIDVDCATNAIALNDPEVAIDFIVNAPNPMHAIDNTGTILWANKSMLTGLGYAHGEYVGHKISEFLANKQIEEFHSNTQTIFKKGILDERGTFL